MRLQRLITITASAIIALPIFAATSILPGQAAAPWGSIGFNGTQYLSSTNMSAPGTGAFTYEFWFYNTSEVSTNQVLMNTRQSISVGQQKDGFDVYISANRGLGATYKNLGFFYSGDGSIAVNHWYHFAIVRTANNVYGYLNGSLIGSVLLDSDGRNLYSSRIWIGTSLGGATPFYGNISNFRYTKTALYSTNFSVPTDDYQEIANTNILLQTKEISNFFSNLVAGGATFTNNGSATATSLNPFEWNIEQARLAARAATAEAEANRKRLDEEKAAAVRVARAKINTALANMQPLTSKDLADADLPIKLVDSLLAAYKELISIKYSLTQPLSAEAVAELKFNKFMKYAIVERITGVSSGSFYGRDLVKFGLIDESAPMKQLTSYRLAKKPLTERDSLQKIEEYFKKSAEEFLARRERLASIIAKIKG